MASHLQLIVASPRKFIMVIYDSLVHIFIVVMHRLLLPHASRAVTFRTEIARCVLGSLLANFWDLLFKAPLGLSDERYKPVELGSIPVMMIPPGATISGARLERKRKRLILLYGHGGGFMFGEPLMWIATYERWVAAAKAQGFDLIVLAVKYRLSPQARFPACRDDFLAVYHALLGQCKISPDEILFCGDSAGGGLAAMAVLYARKIHLPLPCGLVLISPWLDLTLNDTLDSPAMATDFLITFKDVNPGIVDALLPSKTEPRDPCVSPLFDDLKSLPPQLIFAGTAEVLLPDSINWARKSLEAGNEVEFIRGKGEMHTYAMGWPICSFSVESETDKTLIKFLKRFIG